jgi:mitofusin 2
LHYFNTKSSCIIFREMLKIMETIYNRSQEQTHLKMCQKKEFQEKLNFTEQQLINITNQMKMKIHQMVDDVEDKVNLFYTMHMFIK